MNDRFTPQNGSLIFEDLQCACFCHVMIFFTLQMDILFHDIYPAFNIKMAFYIILQVWELNVKGETVGRTSFV